MNTLFPRQPVPSLEVSTIGGPLWKLADQSTDYSLLVFYRGRHCPLCSKSLADLERKLGDFADKSVSVIAVSSDNEERAEDSKKEWNLENLTIGYGLSLDKAREWGLFISSGIGKTSIGVEEPALFSEPGLFLVKSDGTLFFSSVQTMPFARPHFVEVLAALDFIIERGYPARGEVVDHTA